MCVPLEKNGGAHSVSALYFELPLHLMRIHWGINLKLCARTMGMQLTKLGPTESEPMASHLRTGYSEFANSRVGAYLVVDVDFVSICSKKMYHADVLLRTKILPLMKF